MLEPTTAWHRPALNQLKSADEMKKMMCEAPKRLSSVAVRKCRAGEGSVQKQEVEGNISGGLQGSGNAEKEQGCFFWSTCCKDTIAGGPGPAALHLPAASNTTLKRLYLYNLYIWGFPVQKEESSGHKTCPLLICPLTKSPSEQCCPFPLFSPFSLHSPVRFLRRCLGASPGAGNHC